MTMTKTTPRPAKATARRTTKEAERIPPSLASVPIEDTGGQYWVYDPVSETEARYITVGPDLAQQWLDRHNQVNRNKRPRVIGGYAHDMNNDRWRFTSDTVKFGIDGLLYDGQHRLEAITKSGKAQRLLVVRGIHPDARGAMDNNALRRLGDDLRIENYTAKNLDLLVAIAGRALLWDMGCKMPNYAPRNISRLEKRGFIGEHPELEYATRRAMALYAALGKKIPPSILGVCFWIVTGVDEKQGEQFFEQLETSVGYTALSPVKALDKRTRGDTGGITDADWLYLILKAWVLYRSDRPAERLQLPRNRQLGRPMKPSMIPDPALILPPARPREADGGMLEFDEDTDAAG